LEEKEFAWLSFTARRLPGMLGSMDH
jgi:hypothetical protein